MIPPSLPESYTQPVVTLGWRPLRPSILPPRGSSVPVLGNDTCTGAPIAQRDATVTVTESAARQAAGFSLMEVLVTVAILGILASLAAPSFNDLIAGQRANSAASDLHVALIKTRSEATKRNANVTLSPNSGGWQYGWQLINPSDSSVIDAHAATSGLTIAGPASVIYQGSGRVQGSAPSFLITSTAVSSVQRCVSVDLSGRAYVKKSSC